MFVTTAGRTNDALIEKAKSIADEFSVEYIPRRKSSIQAIQQLRNDDCIVIGKNRMEMYAFGVKEAFFFHPNSAMFRIKRIIRGEHDPFLQACRLKEGDRFLDCTLGLASDSIVASYAVGNEGEVVGVEGSLYLAYLVKEGLQQWESNVSSINGAMKKICVIHQQALDFLRNQKSKQFDCIYFDPMFEAQIDDSDGIHALRRFAIYEDITTELMDEAMRVAKRRVVIKDHFRSSRFQKYGFQVNVRESAKFHYGVLEKE
ncbi:class I SAM-dependent methyltransferase [Cytobacillus sp. Hz8]|uniref:class I SAM-dependent methyltransferase n=1 Tax=Cytobacillus sp. Hz8 TaxID=3347168 RepID=UPI0035D7F060